MSGDVIIFFPIVYHFFSLFPIQKPSDPIGKRYESDKMSSGKSHSRLKNELFNTSFHNSHQKKKKIKIKNHFFFFLF